METPEELVKMLNNPHLYLKQSRDDGWYFNSNTDVKVYAKVQLKSHINFPHIIKHQRVLSEYACIHCGYGFNTPDYNSMKLHMKEGDIECDNGFLEQQCCCGKRFDTLDDAYEHCKSTNCQFERWQREQTQPKKQVVVRYTDHDEEEEKPKEVKRVMTDEEKREERKREFKEQQERIKQKQEEKKRKRREKRKQKREQEKEERERKKAEKKAQKKKEAEEKKAREKEEKKKEAEEKMAQKKKEREEQKAQKKEQRKKEREEQKAREKEEKKKLKQEQKAQQKAEKKKARQNNKRKCELCNVVFRGPQEEERHMNGKFHKLKANPNVLSCSHCEMVFQRQKHLDDHLLTKKHLHKIQECPSSSLPKIVCASSCEV
jgi:chemotaxis protein histidine kinase CheA